MSLFANTLYDYWDSRFLYLWSIKHIQLNSGLLSILDSRAYTCLSLMRQLSSNPNTEYSADEFGYIPCDYDDLVAFSYIAHKHLKSNHFPLTDRTIIYIP